jgi:hypothetical protein
MEAYNSNRFDDQSEIVTLLQFSFSYELFWNPDR